MVNKTHRAPSRERYEEHHPVLALRVSAEEKARIEGEAAAVGQSVGEYLRQRAGLSNAVAAQVAPNDGIDATLRKLEIKTTLAVSRRTLSGPNWAAYQNVVEYRSTVAQIEYLESRTMDLPLSGLEAALPRVLKRAADVTELPALHESIHGMEERLSDLEENASRWERHNAALAAKYESLRASVRAYEERIGAVREESGMTESGILRSLRDYVNFRDTVNWLAQQRNQLSWECQQAQSALSRIQSRIAGATAQFERAKELRNAEFGALAERLTMHDVFRLVDCVANKESRRVLAELSRLVTPTTRSLPAAMPSRPPATPRSEASVAAQIPVPADRVTQALPTGSALGPATSNNGQPPAQDEKSPSGQPGNTTADALPAFEDLLRSILAPTVPTPGPPTGLVLAENEMNKRPSDKGLRSRVLHRRSRHRHGIARGGRARGGRRARNSGGRKEKSDCTRKTRKRRMRTNLRH